MVCSNSLLEEMWLYKLAASTPTRVARSLMLAALKPFCLKSKAASILIISLRELVSVDFIRAIVWL
jgi:hypothetical protein